MKLATLILSGGKSSRMGTDKGSLKKEGKLWVEILRDEVSSFSDVFLSVGNHNQELYKNVEGVELVYDLPLKNLAGPLVGLLSAKEKLRAFDKLLVVPCDMINLTKKTLLPLTRQPKTACYLSGEQIIPMPFCILTSDLMRLTNLENKSLRQVLKELNPEFLETDDQSSFENFNRPSDLEE